MTERTLLIILDGWGLGTHPETDAIAQAATPFMDSLYETYPHTVLITFGSAVGLPEGQMGNSEVGHIHIGAGRVIPQELPRIDKAIKEGHLAHNKPLQEAIGYVKQKGKAMHLMGLISDGGVHSHIRHVQALLQILHQEKVGKVYLHAFTDGRDTAPHSGIHFLKTLYDKEAEQGYTLASIIGRYYAMDRDKRWERTQTAYEALVEGKGAPFTDPVSAVQRAYSKQLSDEFLLPLIRKDKGKIIGRIQEGDALICCNFRTDRCQQISEALCMAETLKKPPLGLHYITMTPYKEAYNFPVLFDKIPVEESLGAVLAAHNKRQLRIAETEKYPHVTFFFNGGNHTPFCGEERLLIPSPKVPTYDMQPEMSAPLITHAAVEKIKEKTYDFICINFANTDMVGHTGVFEAAMKAAASVDKCVESIVKTALSCNYNILILADHGNADCMQHADGTPHTAHTMNLVPCLLVQNHPNSTLRSKGSLADVAPTLLQLMGLPQARLMTGKSLLVKK